MGVILEICYTTSDPCKDVVNLDVVILNVHFLILTSLVRHTSVDIQQRRLCPHFTFSVDSEFALIVCVNYCIICVAI